MATRTTSSPLSLGTPPIVGGGSSPLVGGSVGGSPAVGGGSSPVPAEFKFSPLVTETNDIKLLTAIEKNPYIGEGFKRKLFFHITPFQVRGEEYLNELQNSVENPTKQASPVPDVLVAWREDEKKPPSVVFPGSINHLAVQFSVFRMFKASIESGTSVAPSAEWPIGSKRQLPIVLFTGNELRADFIPHLIRYSYTGKLPESGVIATLLGRALGEPNLMDYGMILTNRTLKNVEKRIRNKRISLMHKHGETTDFAPDIIMFDKSREERVDLVQGNYVGLYLRNIRMKLAIINEFIELLANFKTYEVELVQIDNALAQTSEYGRRLIEQKENPTPMTERDIVDYQNKILNMRDRRWRRIARRWPKTDPNTDHIIQMYDQELVPDSDEQRNALRRMHSYARFGRIGTTPERVSGLPFCHLINYLMRQVEYLKGEGIQFIANIITGIVNLQISHAQNIIPNKSYRDSGAVDAYQLKLKIANELNIKNADMARMLDDSIASFILYLQSTPSGAAYKSLGSGAFYTCSAHDKFVEEGGEGKGESKSPVRSSKSPSRSPLAPPPIVVPEVKLGSSLGGETKLGYTTPPATPTLTQSPSLGRRSVMSEREKSFRHQYQMVHEQTMKEGGVPPYYLNVSMFGNSDKRFWETDRIPISQMVAPGPGNLYLPDLFIVSNNLPGYLNALRVIGNDSDYDFYSRAVQRIAERSKTGFSGLPSVPSVPEYKMSSLPSPETLSGGLLTPQASGPDGSAYFGPGPSTLPPLPTPSTYPTLPPVPPPAMTTTTFSPLPTTLTVPGVTSLAPGGLDGGSLFR